MTSKFINTKNIFLIDGLGALASSLLLLTVLKPWANEVGLPPKTLAYLGYVALLIIPYSVFCHFLVRSQPHIWLRVLASINLLYCMFTGMLLHQDYPTLTWLGIAYFSGEISIIGILICFEFQFSKKKSPLH
ncbi:MAG: hypothetical protein K2Q22_04840 [Cytophagales bacterium]|nr:hypothetical protein [Cytophagales bacterium]